MKRCTVVLLGLFGLICSGQVSAQVSVRYVHTDALGSVAVVTDANAIVVERREFEPYGLQLAPSPEDGPGFTGHVQDASTGLTYMQQRYYDPTIGRFLSVDPVAANSGTGANFNRYKYAANNPYKFTDPDGRYECKGGSEACKVVDRAVNAMTQALSGLKPGSAEYAKINGALQALGAKGEKTGIVFQPQSLKGDRVFARAGQNGVIRIDTGKIERGLPSYSAANSSMSSGQVSDALGGRAVTHETQHIVDYKDKNLGYPTSRDQAIGVERSAYTTQAAFDKGLGFHSDIWNSQMTPEQQSQAIERATERSVNNVWGAQ